MSARYHVFAVLFSLLGTFTLIILVVVDFVDGGFGGVAGDAATAYVLYPNEPYSLVETLRTSDKVVNVVYDEGAVWAELKGRTYEEIQNYIESVPAGGHTLWRR